MLTKLKTAIIGASGYTGSELAKLISAHPNFELSALCVSQNSADASKALSQINGSLPPAVFSQPELQLKAISEEEITLIGQEMDLVFLALPHEVSHEWAPKLVAEGATVLDLSGAYRLSNPAHYSQFYGFTHEHASALNNAAYGLAEWNEASISEAKLVAVPGCYPTASLLALKPLLENNLLAPGHFPIINATSGVSGAGRKASMTSSFCEVSLQAYGVLGHRHQPEITEHLGTDVIFTPHLGSFKRGILATITVKMNESATEEAISNAFTQAYANQPLVHLSHQWPKLDDVVNTPSCHLHWKFDAENQYLVVSSAIDNLLKGAASQAVQCANLTQGLPHSTGLVLGGA